MVELTQAEILDIQAEGTSFAIFFYTPMCGTCKVGERMLSIILEMAPTLKLVKCNINYAPDLVYAWRIESIPCLALIKQGILYKKEYAMQSVDHLYQYMKPLLSAL